MLRAAIVVRSRWKTEFQHLDLYLALYFQIFRYENFVCFKLQRPLTCRSFLRWFQLSSGYGRDHKRVNVVENRV